MKTLCTLIITASMGNWYFGYTVGLWHGRCANAKPSPPHRIQRPIPAPAKPAKPAWRELDGDSMLPVREEYVGKSREEIDGLLLFGNETIKLNLSKRK